MQPRNSSQLSYFQRYTLLQCSSFHYSMKCQYFVAFILITICSRIILSSFLYEKERRDREESNATEEFILAIVFPEIHSVIVFFISLFHEMSIFCCFYTHNYMFPNNLLSFLVAKERRDREESNATEEFILAIVFPEIHSVIVFFISLFHEMSIFCCFYTHNYMFPNNFIQFSL